MADNEEQGGAADGAAGAGAGAGDAGGSPGGGSSAPPPPAPADPKTAAPAWYDGIKDTSLREKVMGQSFPDLEALAHSQVNLLALRGVPENQLLRLPQREDDPAWKGVHERLGCPPTADGYKIEVPKEHQELLDQGRLGELRKIAHAHGVPQKAFEAMVKFDLSTTAAQLQAYQQEGEAKIETEKAQWKKECGDTFDKRESVIKRAMKKLGWSEEFLAGTISGSGYYQTMANLHALGAQIGEDPFVDADRGERSSGTNPAEAKAKMAAKMKDPAFVKRLSDQNSEESKLFLRWAKIRAEAEDGEE